jgi:predicted metal-dependent peptidase
VARRPARPDPAAEARDAGLQLVRRHPLFAPLAGAAQVVARPQGSRCPPAGWAVVTSTGVIDLNPRRRGAPDEWAWVIAHCLLHLGFDHLAEQRRAGWTAAAGAPESAGYDREWNAAACLAVNRFLRHLKIGQPPAGTGGPTAFDHLVAAVGAEEACARTFRERGLPAGLGDVGVAHAGADLLWLPAPAQPSWQHRYPSAAGVTWPDRLAAGLSAAVVAAVDVAGGAASSLAGHTGRHRTAWQAALDWFVSSYPLLGGLAAAFRLVEDADIARAHDVRIAAISPVAAELYVNPQVTLTAPERRFVVAHELLHAGLRHDTRAAGRDPWLWNVACDFVINGWLVEMGVGETPEGVLHDPALTGMSAEEVYDRITADWRRYRKLATLRGRGLGDVLPGRLPGLGDATAGVDLDEFYRRSLLDGVGYHRASRGLLPAGLVEEIRALGQPPIPWDVQLARWFDDHFAPVERRRSYARASRRQSATPHIPRPGWHVPYDPTVSRTFGVVLDTSGSMDQRLLGQALGAIASYSVTRDVPAVRVVFCDAQAYDNGWMAPADIATRVTIRGRGGTVLQPGIDLLQNASDFPADGPILIITDGECDRVTVKRDHAILTPAGARLPFTPRGPVFRLR